jgi:tRNA G18 (ribose-2'-O)-methylase SpoU
VRSAHNAGSLLRTADGLGVEAVYFTGYTPYPEMDGDERPPHIRQKISKSIAKTALGAEKTQAWQHYQDINAVLLELRKKGFEIVALEQSGQAINLSKFEPSQKTAVLIGNEVDGLDEKILGIVSRHVHIPMLGAKESFNVSVAAAIALYHLRHLDKDPS